jgi:PAS domain S-box-containing protein
MTDTMTVPDPDLARLEELARHRILDTPAEQGFDDAVTLLRTVCNVPIALVTLVDRDRQWFKAALGVDVGETARATSVCSLAIEQQDLFIIPDLAADQRTANMSLVTGPERIRFYAGMPLVTKSGIAVGSLCAIDTEPRPGGLDDQQRDALVAIGRSVMALIDARIQSNVQEQRHAQAIDSAAVLENMLEAQRRGMEEGHSLDTLLMSLLTSSLSAIKPATGAVVVLRNQDALVYRTVVGRGREHAGLRFNVEDSLSGRAILEKRIVVTGDVLKEGVNRDLLAKLGYRSAIIIPLVRSGEPFGVLKVHAEEEDAFGADDVLIAQMLASIVASAFSEAEAETALSAARRTETIFRSVVDSAIDTALIGLDAAGQINVWSRGAETILGWDEQEVIGKPLALIFTPEDRASRRPETEMRIARAEGHASDERWHIRKDGTRFYAHGSVTPLRGEAGGGFVKSLRDITNDKCAEDRRTAMIRLQDELRDGIDIADLLASAARITGEALNVDRAGYGTVDADGTHADVLRDWHSEGLASVVGQHAMQSYGSYVANLMRGEAITVADVRHDTRLNAPQMEAIGVRAFLNLPVLERGRMVALFFMMKSEPHEWTADEITFAREVADRTRQAVERRRAETALEQANSELTGEVASRTRERDRLWRMSQDMMLVAGSDGVMREVNTAWTTILGWQEDELLGRPIFDFIHPDDLQHTLDGAAAIGEGRSFTRFDNRYRTKDGDYRSISWTAGPAENTIIAIGRDVTEQRNIEERLRQSQKMEAVGQLTGGIAHDFNNMLTGVTGSLELLKRYIRDGRQDRIDRYIDAATTSAHRAAGLTQRLLAFSRRQSLDVRSTDVNQLVIGMEDLLRRTLGESVGLEISLHADLWCASTDANQLESALLNLTINARDAMPEGGRLTIETTNTRLDQRYVSSIPGELAPGDYVVLCVSDTGTGMTPEVMAKVFDPFFTTKPIGQGTGLGLSMIYGFAQQSKGHVRVYSKVDQGTTFKLYLPRDTQGSVEAEGSAAPVRLAGAGECVMLVEDDPAVRMLVVDTLEELGYDVVQASDGRQAIPLLDKANGFDLLITDVGLPGLNGRQVAEMARQRFPDLKVLFITGYAEKAAVRGDFLAEGMEMITKPFAIDALAAKIRDMIEEDRKASA